LRGYRYVGHAALLLIAAAMSGYTPVDSNLPIGARPAALNAQAADEGNSAGDVALDRDSTIIKPISIPTAPLPNRKPIVYTVKGGDTLESVAHDFGIPFRDITWSNSGLRVPLRVGQALQLPPVPGVVIVVKGSDSAASLAATYGADVTTILGFNHVRGQELTPGSVLVIPVDPEIGPNLSTGVLADPVAPSKLMCPIPGASIIQKFGPTSFALEPPYGGYAHFHTGLDVLAGYGTPILAAAGGIVTAAGYADYFGLRVEITDSFGLVEIYAHMSQVTVSVGEAVQQGKKVGFVGSTGLSIAPHLHFQLEVGGAPTDPTPLVGC
jgi:murein DD-endopeptidase MepM/ murein hydrolase activator NlpD